MKTAFLFPGQGSHKTNLLYDLPDSPHVEQVLAIASRVLGESAYFYHTAEQLQSTTAVQISLFISGVASFKAFEAEGVKPDFVAGHSVGAFSAATAAGAIRFEDGLKIVKLRGELMENAFGQDYGMGVVLGMEEKELQSIIDCHSNHQSPVYMSNRNAPDQFTISGSIAGIQKILDQSKENGARCAALLKVPIPSHCPLLQDISSALKGALHDIPLYRPNIPYTGNLTGRLLYNTVDIRQDLAESVSSPVRWHDAISVLYEKTARLFIEMLPGNVLSRLAAAAFPDARVMSMAENGFEDCLFITKRELAKIKKTRRLASP